MVKTWSADNPKAALMARKRAAIVAAALNAFLDAGYAGASVNHIADSAGVSIKTLYRHFETKDELFAAVMHAACGDLAGEHSTDDGGAAPVWYSTPPAEALPAAGAEYLRNALSADQLALYRVVTRDGHQFPELAKRYHDETTGRRDATFAGYLDLWAARAGWTVHDKQAAAQVFAALLKANIFDQALLGLSQPSEADILEKAHDAAHSMLLLLDNGRV
jgi:AcrR family transcriptional regulator